MQLQSSGLHKPWNEFVNNFSNQALGQLNNTHSLKCTHYPALHLMTFSGITVPFDERYWNCYSCFYHVVKQFRLQCDGLLANKFARSTGICNQEEMSQPQLHSACNHLKGMFILCSNTSPVCMLNLGSGNNGELTSSRFYKFYTSLPVICQLTQVNRVTNAPSQESM